MSQQTQPATRARPVGPLQAFREAPGPVKTVIIGVFINRLGQFLTLFLVLYLTSKGYSAEQASLALGAYGAGAVAGVLIGGTLTSRIGPRNATAISMGGTFVVMAVWVYLPSYPILLCAAVLYAVLGQLYRPASSTLLSELTSDDRQVMIFGLYRFGLNLGTTAAPMLGLGLYYLGSRHYTLVFWGEAVVSLCYAVFAWIALPPRRAAAGAGDAPDGPAASDGERGEQAGPGGRWSSGYLAMLRDRRYMAYLVAFLVHSAVYVQYLSTLPLNVRSAKVALIWYTLAISLNGFIVICFELLVTKVTQTWPMRLSIGITLASLGVGVAVYGLPFGPAVIISGTLIWSLGEIIGGPAAFAYPAVIAPPRLKSHYISGFQFVFGLGSAIGPALGGWLFVRLGHGAWPVIALGSAVATVLALVSVHQPQATSTSS